MTVQSVIDTFIALNGSEFEGAPISFTIENPAPCECCDSELGGDRFELETEESFWQVCGGCYVELMKT